MLNFAVVFGHISPLWTPERQNDKHIKKTKYTQTGSLAHTLNGVCWLLTNVLQVCFVTGLQTVYPPPSTLSLCCSASLPFICLLPPSVQSTWLSWAEETLAAEGSAKVLELVRQSESPLAWKVQSLVSCHIVTLNSHANRRVVLFLCNKSNLRSDQYFI